MSDIYLWCVTGMTALVTLDTLWRLWSERERLSREDLTDEDRGFAWRIVVFLIFPLVTFMDLRATTLVCDLLGGHIRHWSYGLLWYHAVPAGLHSAAQVTLVLFAGCLVECLLALCLLPALMFRPHPFLSTLVGYTVAFILGLNLLVDPILSFAGMGGVRWQMAYSLGSWQDKAVLLVAHAALGALYLFIVSSRSVRMWFSSLTRPMVGEDLALALNMLKSHPAELRHHCRVGLLYEKAGLRRQAYSQLRSMKAIDARSLYCSLLEGLLCYKKRDYVHARRAFMMSSDADGVLGVLKANFLAAAACCAFADGDVTGALNLSDRALEFDPDCTVARMVKVDVYLRTGKKEQAGEEILQSMRRGLRLELENKVPLDADYAIEGIAQLQAPREVSGTFSQLSG